MIDSFVLQVEHRDPSFFAMIPKMALLDLAPYEFKLYCYYKQVVGENFKITCWASTATIAEECQISERQVYDSRDELERLGYIKVLRHPSKTAVVTLNDLWSINHQRFAFQGEFETGLHTVQTISAHSATKEEPIEEEKKNSPSSVPLAGLPDYSLLEHRLPPRPTTPGITEAKGEKKGYTAQDPELPEIARDLFKLLGERTRHYISMAQVKDLNTPVANDKGVFPSPSDERREFPDAWQSFCIGIPASPVWRKRVIEDRTRLTVGFLVDFFRGYHWKGGWLEYRPDPHKPEKQNPEDWLTEWTWTK